MTVPSNLIPVRVLRLPEAPIASPDFQLVGSLNGTTYRVRAGDLLDVSGVPTTRQVLAGTGLTGGGTLANDVTLSIAPNGVDSTLMSLTGVAAGTYGSSAQTPLITVDAAGRVESIVLVGIAGTAGGTVTNVSLSLSDGITGSVTDPTFMAVVNLSLGDITPDSVTTGTIDGTDITASGTVSADVATITTSATVAGSPVVTEATGDLRYQPLDADLTSWAAVTRATGFDTFVAVPSSANLAALVTDETGSGALVFGTNATLSGATLTGGSLNNAPVGNVTPSTGAFTTLSATSATVGGSPVVTEATGDTRYVNVTGDTMTGVLFLPAGSVTAPSLAFSGDPNTGMWSAGADEIDFATGGVNRVSITNSFFTSALPVVHPVGSVGSPSIIFSGDANTGLWWPGADQIAVSTAGAERARIDASGNLLVGATTAYTFRDAAGTPKLQLSATDASGAAAMLSRFSATAATGSNLVLAKSAGASVGTFTAVSTGHLLGTLAFEGADGTDFSVAAIVSAEVNGTVAAGSVPADLLFSTKAAGGSLTERMRITNGGRVGIGIAPTLRNLQILDPAGIAINSVHGITVGSGTFRAEFLMDIDSGGVPSTHIRTGSDANGHMAFFTGTGPVERMRIDSAGNIGIGVSPSAALVVNRDTSSAAPNSTAAITFRNKNTTLNGTIAGGVFVDTFRDIAADHYSGGVWFTRNQESANLSSSSDIVFGTQNNNTTNTLPAERMRLKSTGEFIIGGTTAYSFTDSATSVPKLQVQGLDGPDDSIMAATFNAGPSVFSRVITAKSRGATLGSFTAVASGDIIGGYFFEGADGTDFSTGAQILGIVDDTVSAGRVPTALAFGMRPISGAFAERMRITSAGNVGLGIATPTGLGSGGTFTLLQTHNVGTTVSSFGYHVLSSASTANTALMGAIAFGSTGLSGADKRTAQIASQKRDALTVNPVGDLQFQTSNGTLPTTRLTINADGSVTHTPAAANTVWNFLNTVSGGLQSVQITNSATVANSDARLAVSTNGAAAGDPYVVFEISGVQAGHIGLDNSDADTLTICASAAQPGTGNRLALTADGRLYGSALHDNAGAVTGTTNQYIASGTYTPTLTNTTNVAASTAQVARWMRVGNVVTVSGAVAVDPTAAAANTILGISLPIASNFTGTYDCAGAGSSIDTSAESWGFVSSAVNDRAEMRGWATNAVNHIVSYTFTYTIL